MTWKDDRITPTHQPWCGYWFKHPIPEPTAEAIEILIDGWQQSIGIDNTDILFIPMLAADYDVDSGIVAIRYNLADASWHLVGESLGGSPTSAVPNTARICSTFSIYYGDWTWAETSAEVVRLHIFRNGSVTTKDFYDMSVDDYDWESTLYNKADIHSSGLIACILILETAGTWSWTINVSDDFGATWKAAYIFPGGAASYGNFDANVRIDDSGVIWVAFSIDTNVISVYKSTDGGDNWSSVGTCTGAGSTTTEGLIYTVDYTGQYQYLGLNLLSPTAELLYKSEDYGANWTLVTTLTLSPSYDSIKHTSNNQYVVHGRHPSEEVNTFRRTTDSGSSWSDIVPPAVIQGSYTDTQSHKEKIAYTECGAKYGGETLGLMYSPDNGATWTVLNIDTAY